MTRVRADDYDDKRQAILDRAAALIARKGFERATMLDVATACGASKSHVYHYFPTKEELLFSIIKEHITAQMAELEGIVVLPLPAEERFQKFVDSFIQGAARSREEHLVLVNDLNYLPKKQREVVRKLEVNMTALMAQLLREINPELAMDEELLRPYSLLLYGMMIWTFTWYRRNGAISPAELARRISHLFVHGFKGQPLTA